MTSHHGINYGEWLGSSYACANYYGGSGWELIETKYDEESGSRWFLFKRPL